MASSMALQALSKFDYFLREITQQNTSRPHKRLKFVNKSLLEHELVERKLHNYAVANMTPEQLGKLSGRLENCYGESRICEYLLMLIAHAEERLDHHAKILTAVITLVQQIRDSCQDEQTAAMAMEKCSLMVYDSFRFLVNAKRAIVDVARVYHVPFYYDVDSERLRVRSSLLTTFKNLNTTIDDLQDLTDALFVVRNYDVLG